MDYFYLIFGFLLLFFGGDFLVRSSIDLAFRFKVSKLVIGVTIVSLATSAPELLVSLESVFSGHSDIAFGNVIGSNIANIGLVLALTCMVEPIIADRNTIRTNYPFMILCSVLLFLSMLFTDGIPSWVGGVFVVLLTLFLLYVIRKSDNSFIQDDIEVRSISLTKSILTLIGGSFGLYFGADLFINGTIGGSTPATLKVEDDSLDIQLVLDGYEPREFTITKDTQEEMVIRLRQMETENETLKETPVQKATPKPSTDIKPSSKPKASIPSKSAPKKVKSPKKIKSKKKGELKETEWD